MALDIPFLWDIGKMFEEEKKLRARAQEEILQELQKAKSHPNLLPKNNFMFDDFIRHINENRTMLFIGLVLYF